MSFDDFRTYLEYLESEGELKRVSREVDPYLESTLVAKKSIDFQGPALWFEKVKGKNNPIPLTVAVYGTQKRVCMGLDTTPENFTRDYFERSKRMGEFQPKVVKEGLARKTLFRGTTST